MSSPFLLPMSRSVSPQANRHESLNVVLSMMTGPFLVGLIGARAIAEGLTHLGLVSEEFFRGERLPVLPTVPEEASATSDSTNR